MKKILVFFFAMGMLFCSCSGEQHDEPKAVETQENEPAIIHEDWKGEYARLYKKRSNWLRPKSIFEKGKINPFDEALTDTTFFVFREQLLEVIEQKDILKFLDFVAEDIQIAEDSLRGTAALIDRWHLTTPDSIEQSNIWHTLNRILKRGGYFNAGKSTFTAPYYANNKQLSANQGCIIGQGVRIRNRPGLNAKLVKKVSFDIVEVLETTKKKEMIGEEVFPWVRLRLPTGEEGYVWGKFLGRREGEQVVFQQDQSNQWKMIVFKTSSAGF